MADTFDKQKRSDIMSKVKSKDTRPEMVVRKLLFNMGCRYRLNRPDLPGKPDIVLPKYHAVVFVHGCFWHGCPTCKHAQIRPRTNSEYWDKKLDKNIQRDIKVANQLDEIGWHVLVIWECDTRKKNIEILKKKLSCFLQECKQIETPS